MTFQSILFEKHEDRVTNDTPEAPVFFVDLNLDQIVKAITAGRAEYNLKPFFYRSLGNIDAIQYRHEIMQDLENDPLYGHMRSFAQRMRAMREGLVQADKRYYQYQKKSWFLDAAEIYCGAINCLAHDLTAADLKSRGFVAFRQYLVNYAASEPFTALLAETQKLKADLSTVKYCLLIKDNGFRLRKYESETDYSAEVEETFHKFKQGAVKDYSVKFSDWPDMNHVEAKALDFVAQLYPHIFSTLANYCVKNANYLDETIARFDREIQFYAAYLDHIAILKRAGLRFCYPKISNQRKEVYDYEGFDLALAYKLIGEQFVHRLQ
jgi:DNA mismatch repair protein MutS